MFLPSFLSRRAIVPVVLSAVLAACGGSGGGDDHDHENTTIDTAGRLTIAEIGAANVRVYDLDTARVEATFAVSNPPAAVYASPGKRYAVIPQRAQNLVQFIDAGIWQEDHVDHLHDYKQAPRLTDFRLTGSLPTHYDDRGTQAAVFFDAATPPTTLVSSAVLFTDATIGKGTVTASLTLKTAMHGFAEPNGDFLIATYRDPASTSVLPSGLEVYRRNGSAYDFVQKLPTECPEMHGSYTRGNVTVAGCTSNESVIIASPQGTGFTSSSIKVGPVIGTITGHPKFARFVGIGNTGSPVTTKFYDIDATAKTSSVIPIAGWADGRLVRAYRFDRSGRYFMVLDDVGTLYVLEPTATGWVTRKAIAGVVPSMPAASPFPMIVANESKDEVYVSDPNGSQLVVIDVARQEVKQRVALGFKPSYLAWTGIAR